MNKMELGKKVIQTIRRHGYQAYYIGGCVRDRLLQREINDVDIATNAFPEMVMKLFAKVIPTGIKHGTVTVMINHIPFEVTTFRKEGSYEDFRRPNEVQFVPELYQDLSRRDFTMNAIAMNEQEELIDPFHGKEAIQRKEIISVGFANERFLEDPLRMMRAIRFASQLDFTIEQETWKAIVSQASYLQYIAPERIKIEFDKIMKSGAPEIGIQQLFQADLIRWIRGLNETGITAIDVNQVAPLIKKTDDYFTRWSIFLHMLLDEKRLLFLKRLRFSKQEITIMKKIDIAYLLFQESINEVEIKSCLIQMDVSCCLKGIDMLAIIKDIQPDKKRNWYNCIIAINQELMVKEVKDLAISGQDLIQLFKKPPGPWVNSLLQELLEQVVFQGLTNDKRLLLEQAKMSKEGKEHEK